MGINHVSSCHVETVVLMTKNTYCEAEKILVVRDFRDLGQICSGVAEILYSVCVNLAKFDFLRVVVTILLLGRLWTRFCGRGDDALLRGWHRVFSLDYEQWVQRGP